MQLIAQFYIITSMKACYSLFSPRTRVCFRFAIVIGLASSGIEYLFALGLQEFLSRLGVVAGNGTVNLAAFNFPFIVIGLIVVSALRAMLEAAKIYVARTSMQVFSVDNRVRLIRQALSQANKISSGQAVNLFSDETQRASTSILNLSSFSINLVNALSLGLAALWVAPQAFLLGVVLLGFFFVPLMLIGKRTNSVGAELSKEWTDTSRALTDGLRNNFYLNVIGLVSTETHKAQISLERHLSIYKKAFITLSLKSAVPSFFGTLVVCGIATYQYKANAWGSGFPLLTFFYLFLRFTQALSISANLLNDFRLNVQSVSVLNQFFSSNSAASQSLDIETPFASPISVGVKEMTFSYDDKCLLKNITFELGASQCLVITGESGSGKSTLLSLILGLMEPTRGEILIDGSPATSVRGKIASSIGYVGPFPYLIEGTLRDNLNYGHPSPSNHSDAYMKEVLMSVRLEALFREMPEGLETSLDEVGSRLSAGQKQRLMLARALLRRPRLLVLDEPTSNLDEETEKELIESLRPLIKECTTIIVTHRSAIKQLGNRVLELS